jgi:hypothetical protein
MRGLSIYSCSLDRFAGDAKAIKKVGQALREDAPDIRGDIHAGSDDDESAAGGGAQAPIMTVVPLPPTSTPSMVLAPGTTVSARGGKMSAAPAMPPPQPGGPSRSGGGGDPYGTAPMGVPASAGGGKFSGAAAAAVQDSEYMPAPRDRDVAFGRQFHMALPETGSDISGLSYVPGTMISGMSGVSALTDPSLLGGGQANSLRISQLNQVRQQWAAQHHGNSLQAGDNSSTTRMMLSSQNGLGNSLQASGAFNNRGAPQQRSHSSRSFQDVQSVNDAMSWADHSLVGGGISGGRGAGAAQHRSNSYYDGASVANASVMQQSVSGNQSLFGANQSLGSYSMTSKDDSWIGGGHRYQQQPHQPHDHHHQQQQQQQQQASAYYYNGMTAATGQQGVAASEDMDRSKSTTSSRSTAHQRNMNYAGGAGGDRSIHSAGDESVSMQSIVSSLSENLIALDLAGTHATTSSLLDHL